MEDSQSSSPTDSDSTKDRARITTAKIREDLEIVWEKYGVYGLSDAAINQVFFPPPPSEHPPVRGRENLKDLATVRGLYMLLESQQRDQEEKMMDEIERQFTVDSKCL